MAKFIIIHRDLEIKKIPHLQKLLLPKLPTKNHIQLLLRQNLFLPLNQFIHAPVYVNIFPIQERPLLSCEPNCSSSRKIECIVSERQQVARHDIGLDEAGMDANGYDIRVLSCDESLQLESHQLGQSVG